MPTKHCRACQQEQTTCLCNSCQRDSLYQAPACCAAQRVNDAERPGHCIVACCPDYLSERLVADWRAAMYRKFTHGREWKG